MSFPTYTAEPTLRLHAVEHLDGVTVVYSFPYTPVSQEEAWIFDDLYDSYGNPQLPTAPTLVTAPALATQAGAALVKV